MQKYYNTRNRPVYAGGMTGPPGGAIPRADGSIAGTIDPNDNQPGYVWTFYQTATDTGSGASATVISQIYLYKPE